MKTDKRLGIWMDNAHAHLIEFRAIPADAQVVVSASTHQEKVESLNKSEQLMHNKEQHQQAAYYKNLGNTILEYDEVLLFGPTNAKNELYNILKADHLFEHIKIEVKEADKMTDNQEHAFVRDHFSMKN